MIKIQLRIFSQYCLKYKLRKYEFLANYLRLIYKDKTKIFPYVVAWDDVVTITIRKISKNRNIFIIRSLNPVNGTEEELQSISLEQRQEHNQGDSEKKDMEYTVQKLVESK